MTRLVALSTLKLAHTNGTEVTAYAMVKLLNYCATRETILDITSNIPISPSQRHAAGPGDTSF